VLPDGVTFVREAVLRPVADVRRPLIALAWEDGARATYAPVTAAAATVAPSLMTPAKKNAR